VNQNGPEVYRYLGAVCQYPAWRGTVVDIQSYGADCTRCTIRKRIKLQETIVNEMGFYSTVPLWVFESLVETKQTEALRLYVGLAKWTNGGDRNCHPSRKTIAKYIGCSVRTVDSYVATLVDIGALTVTPRRNDEDVQTSNQYTVMVARPLADYCSTPRAADVATPVQQTAPEVLPIEVNPVELELFAPSQAIDAGKASDAAFEKFWETYRRTGPKKTARASWKVATSKSTSHEIQAGLELWIAYWDSPGATSMKWPQGWLSQERWKGPPPRIQTQRKQSQREQRMAGLASTKLLLNHKHKPQREITK